MSHISPLGSSAASQEAVVNPHVRDRSAARTWQLSSFDRAESLKTSRKETAAAVGLLLEERAQVPTLRVWGDSRRCTLHVPDKRAGGGIRGKAGCSRAVRKRLLDMIHTVRADAALPDFVTLTFTDFFPDFRESKVKLDNLLKRMKRLFPHTSAIWRFECIDRKSGANKGQIAPHFHLLVWGELDAGWLAQAWYEVNGESDYAHVKHGTDVIDLESWAGAVAYCAKDIAKPIQAAAGDTGRVWGVHNRAALPVAQATDVVPIHNMRAAVVIQRTMRRLQRSRDVLEGKRLMARADFPGEKRPEHLLRRARAAFKRTKRGNAALGCRRLTRTIYCQTPNEWLAWLCKL